MTLNWLPNLTLLLFGVIFTAEALQIPTDEESIGARLVPLGMSVITVILVLVQIVNDLREKNAAKEVDLATEASGAGTIQANLFLLGSAPLILMMAVYGLFHVWFGYLIASLLASYLVFRLFGNSSKTVLIHGTIGSALLFLLFIKLLGVYDQPGSLIDISGL